MINVKHINVKDWNKVIVVGDIHGSYDELMELLDNVNFNFSTDLCICCGDLVDRGEKSMKCLNLIYEPWFLSIEGNHERMLCDWIDDNFDSDLFIQNGGLWAYSEDRDVLKGITLDIPQKCPNLIVIDTGSNRKTMLVHAELNLDHITEPALSEKWFEQVTKPRIKGLWECPVHQWERHYIYPNKRAELLKNPALNDPQFPNIISGHTIVDDVVELQKNDWSWSFIDTGAYYTGKLSHVRLK